jgi:hypothetical protein
MCGCHQWFGWPWGERTTERRLLVFVYLLCVCWSKVMVLVLADPVRGGATVYG